MPSVCGFPAAIKNPQPDGVRLAKASFVTARGINDWRINEWLR